jgi:hypothetical protein
MGKAISDAYIDGGLDKTATSTTMTVCSAEPANFAGIAAVALAEETLTGGDFSKANGDVSGRKITVAQQADVDIDASGTATHVVLDDGTDILVTTCTSQALTLGGTVTIPVFDQEIADPSA